MNQARWGIICQLAGVALLLTALFLARTFANHLPTDYPRTVRVNCVNNMKQIGLSFRIWSGDHNDRYPFNLGVLEGGTRESRDAGGDGFDRNSAEHFRILSNELFTPKLLVCPLDTSKQAAVDFGSLGPGNVSYQLQSGPDRDETNPAAVLAICPVHGNILFCDGSVKVVKADQGVETPGIINLMAREHIFILWLVGAVVAGVTAFGLAWAGGRLRADTRTKRARTGIGVIVAMTLLVDVGVIAAADGFATRHPEPDLERAQGFGEEKNYQMYTVMTNDPNTPKIIYSPEKK
ncbi:MAG: hypothetical protein JWR19_3178 [Pedosphaera sp.]|jgi:prepilin-type processing-associated H-X9-DG protein|nr:hypothetical protein [Pedosphaera sp.]